MKRLSRIFQSFLSKDRYIKTESLEKDELNVFTQPEDKEKQFLLNCFQALENSISQNELLEGVYNVKEAKKISSEYDTLNNAIERIENDIKHNLHESKNKEYYDYYYFFDKGNMSSKKICVTARLFKDEDPSIGDVYYDMIIKKYNDSFYLWGFDN